MADYRKIVQHYPEVRDFIRLRRWVHRGEAIVYGPNTQCDHFSTDEAGYRHSTFGGETYSVARCAGEQRYGIVLGPSNVYGFGLAGNENTIPSLLAEKFGFPFANVGLPEGNSRNLFSILLNIVSRAPVKPSVVLHLSGGDFTTYCYTGLADPVFGSPNLKQMQEAMKERAGRTNPDQSIRPLLSFTTLWIGAIVQLCRAQQIPLVIGNDTTFFERQNPSEIEVDCKLGIATSEAQTRQFDIHHKYSQSYYATREKIAENTGTPIAGPGKANDVGFVDEFHYNAAGSVALADDFAKGIEGVL